MDASDNKHILILHSAPTFKSEKTPYPNFHGGDETCKFCSSNLLLHESKIINRGGGDENVINYVNCLNCCANWKK